MTTSQARDVLQRETAMAEDGKRNDLLASARERLGLTQEELADEVNKLVPPAYAMTANDISKLERGKVERPRGPRRQALRTVLGISTDAELGLVRRVKPGATLLPATGRLEEPSQLPTTLASNPPSDELAVPSSVAGISNRAAERGGHTERSHPASNIGDLDPDAALELNLELMQPDPEQSKPRGKVLRAPSIVAVTAPMASEWTGVHVDQLTGSLDTDAVPTDTRHVLRRTILTALSAAATSMLSGQSTQPVRSADVGDPSLMADVDHWREAIWEYGYAYHVAPREEMLADLQADLAAIKAQLTSHMASGAPETKPIAAITAQFVALAAMISVDLGYAREGRHLWRFARRYGSISEDPGVQSWVRGHEVTSGIYQQRPIEVLENLARHAFSDQVKSSITAGGAELLGGYAQVLSLQGRTRESHIALMQLRETYERLPSSVTSLRDSIFGWPEQRLRHVESFTASMAGPTADAYSAQDSALRLYAPTRPISRCQIELHRARCLLRDGYVGEGLRHARDAVATVEMPRRKEFVLAVADRVSEVVPTQERRRVEARELNDLLRIARMMPGE
ncbi:multiprotein-bridging factor 1 family protein [Actinoplanes sp. NPDC000266]